jgi:hypothetical protein
MEISLLSSHSHKIIIITPAITFRKEEEECKIDKEGITSIIRKQRLSPTPRLASVL